ncbi:MAG TPA: hypothetical protein VN429_05015 [Methanospirillum sp.]|uniref:hypothetical protein n=1 Tax=Methanospirillum sp. TaxID=45200 RepID=UPI002C35B90B|nr:hypothetical protein [Methanospirillum sp.]HWQ63756.1 hypothetical protein [Methanospirillum sp.]
MTDQINVKDVPPEIDAIFEDLKKKGFTKRMVVFAAVYRFHDYAKTNLPEASALALALKA